MAKVPEHLLALGQTCKQESLRASYAACLLLQHVILLLLSTVTLLTVKLLSDGTD